MPKTKRAPRKTSKAPAAAEVPEWVTKTMGEMTYGLEIMCGCGDCNTEAVDLTREEYIALKLHLAKMRGIAIPEEANA